MAGENHESNAGREFLESAGRGALGGALVFAVWAGGIHVFSQKILLEHPDLREIVEPAYALNLGVGGLVSALVAGVLAWLRIQVQIQARLNPSNLELFNKLTNDLPGLLYQFRQWPNGAGSVTYASAAIRTIYELEPEEARRDGNQILHLVHPEDHDRIFQSLLRAWESLTPWTEEYRVVLPKAGECWRRGHARVERMPDGGTLWHGFVIDITEDRRAREELIAAGRRAEVASQAKNRVIAMLSHDIRAPLGGILGFAYLLKDSPLTEEQREHVLAVESCGENLLALVDDVLDLAKIEAGHLSVTPSDFPLRNLLVTTVDIFRPKAKTRGIDLQLEIATATPVGIRTDRTRLQQALTNLIANAVKFTKVGSVTVRVESTASPDKTPQWAFRVIDTGPGIPPAQLETIFEEFRQFDREAPAHGGAGLGLSIARKICKTLGGDLQVESLVGKGSTFTATIQAPIAQIPA